MPMVITPLTEEDIPGAIDTIQQAFADNPYNRWIYNGRSKARSTPYPLRAAPYFTLYLRISTPLTTLPPQFSLTRNRVSLGIRCHWGIRNALFHVAKEPTTSTPTKVLGVAMWLPPTPLSAPQTWSSYLQSWQLWLQQLGMNA